jgi:hypothetical protein
MPGPFTTSQISMANPVSECIILFSQINMTPLIVSPMLLFYGCVLELHGSLLHYVLDSRLKGPHHNRSDWLSSLKQGNPLQEVSYFLNV